MSLQVSKVSQSICHSTTSQTFAYIDFLFAKSCCFLTAKGRIFLVGITVSLDYNKNNIVLAKNLRKNATPQENHLWFDFLSKYEIRFQRQKAIGNYIADFYCHKAKLIIEIDGSQHYSEQGLQSDAFRTEVLEGYNLKVLRFTNIQIDTNFVAVCQYIDHVVKAALREGGGPR